MRAPLGSKAAVRTMASWPQNVFSSSRLAASQRRTLRSNAARDKGRPSGLNAADSTQHSRGLAARAGRVPAAASQIRTVPSLCVVAMASPAGLKQALVTSTTASAAAPAGAAAEERTASCLPVCASQMRAVPSALAVTMRAPPDVSPGA